MPRRPHLAAVAAALVVSSAAATTAPAQSIEPAVFVVNNVSHNVAAFTVAPSGQLALVNTFATGLNPQAVSLSPDGRYLAVAHGTSSTTTEELRVYQVAADATLTQVGLTLVPDSPLDVKWVGNDVLAITETRLSGTNQVRTFQFVSGTFDQVGIASTGGFNTRLDFHAPRSILYAQDTSGDTITALRVNPDGSLTQIDSEFTPPGMVGIGITPGGERMIGTTGALASGGRQIWSFPVDASGALGPGPGIFIESPERFPDPIAFSPDGTTVFIGHNDLERTLSFKLDLVTGALTPTGHVFQVGSNLSQGELATLGDLLFVLDESSSGDGFQGIYTLRYDANGAMMVIDQDVTGGSRPMDLAVWQGIPEPSMLGLLGPAAVLLLRRRARGAA